MKYFATPALLLMLLLAGCSTEPEEFTLIYTMESAQNYKISIEIGKDKSYQIRQQNLFFDSHAGKAQINTSDGQMSDEDHALLTELVAGSRLFRMKNEYGFEQKPNPNNPLEGLIYQLTYTQGKKTKYISVRVDPSHRYPDNFLQLLRFLSNYTSQNAP